MPGYARIEYDEQDADGAGDAGGFPPFLCGKNHGDDKSREYDEQSQRAHDASSAVLTRGARRFSPPERPLLAR
jgi:hypothetical protein